MRPLTDEDLSRLLGEHTPPCVSIYVPTHRAYPESQQDPLAYRHLVDRAEESLRQCYPGSHVRSLLEKFRTLVDDHVFWTHRLEGMAAFGSPSLFEVFDLQRAVPALAIVADSFHIKPLLRLMQSVDRFHVLCLQRDSLRLYEGNRDQLDPIEPEGVPLTADATLDQQVTARRPQAEFAEEQPTHQNTPPGLAAARNDATFEVERFFRAIDQAIWERLSRPSRLPLVLVGLPEHQSWFREISQNPQLIDAGVARGPSELSPRDLLSEVWKCVEPRFLDRLEKITNDFQVARARHMASDNLQEVSQAVARDRVGILLVEAEQTVRGRFDVQTGKTYRTDESDPAAEDVLDDLAERVWRTDGSVVVVPRERMPAATGLAAIYRF